MCCAPDRYYVRSAITMEVAATEVLRRDLAVDDALVPIIASAIEMVGGNAMVLAAVAGEDFVVAISINISDPEGVALRKRVVKDRARAQMERFAIVGATILNIVSGVAHRHGIAVPRLDGGNKPPPIF